MDGKTSARIADIKQKRTEVLIFILKLRHNRIEIQHVILVVISCTGFVFHTCDVEVPVDRVAVGAVVNEGTAKQRDADFVKRDVKIEISFRSILNGNIVTHAGGGHHFLAVGGFHLPWSNSVCHKFIMEKFLESHHSFDRIIPLPEKAIHAHDIAGSASIKQEEQFVITDETIYCKEVEVIDLL